MPDAPPEPIVIYGASGFSMAVREMIELGLPGQRWRVVAHIDDTRPEEAGRQLGDVPVIGFDTWRERMPGHACALAVGDCRARRRLAERVRQAGGTMVTAWAPGGSISPSIAVGEGTIIGLPAYVGPFTRFGANVLQMPMSVVGHDVSIGDCCTLCSSSSIAGFVALEDEVFIGAGAVVINGRADGVLRVGRGAVIGAGAVVTKSVAAGAMLMGNPARPIRALAAARRRER